MWSSRQSKLKDFPMKLNYSESSSKKQKGSYSMLKAIKFKLESLLRNVSITRTNWKSLGTFNSNIDRSMKNLIRFAKPFIMKTKLLKTNSMRWISLWNKNMNHKDKKIQNYWAKSKNGKLDIKHLKKANQNSSNSWEIWWRAKENLW